MIPENPDIPRWEPGLLDYVGDFFRGLPAALIVMVTAALLALALWLGGTWWPNFLIIYAIKSAPLVTSSSAQPGVVKLAGQAQPASAHATSPYSNTPYVWFEADKLDTRSTSSLRRSGSYSVGPIVIRDASGACVIDPQGRIRR